MANRRWMRWDNLMRVSHLYTGLFLVPWMLVYAVSAFSLNHKEWFTEGLNLKLKWENVSEVDFTAGPEFPQTPEEQAVAILRHVDLEGQHRILGHSNADRLVIFRYCVAGHYRVSWFPRRSRVVVDRRLPTSFYSVVNALHFRHGYGQMYFAHLVWAIIVDVTTISTVIWVISGIWLWARRTHKRLLGGMCLTAGSLLFVGLVILLCR